MPERYFVSGIGTGVGKTLVSVILCRTFHLHYWKPVQTGTIESGDYESVQQWLSDKPECVVHPPVKSYPEPLSPHFAAILHNDIIDPSEWTIPDTGNASLLIEGAGGICVPINEQFFMHNLSGLWNAPMIIVIRNYLGCINHSLLTFHFLLSHHIPVRGIVLNGNFELPVKNVILRHCPFPLLGEIEELSPHEVKSLMAPQKIHLYETL